MRWTWPLCLHENNDKTARLIFPAWKLYEKLYENMRARVFFPSLLPEWKKFIHSITTYFVGYLPRTEHVTPIAVKNFLWWFSCPISAIELYKITSQRRDPSLLLFSTRHELLSCNSITINSLFAKSFSCRQEPLKSKYVYSISVFVSQGKESKVDKRISKGSRESRLTNTYIKKKVNK